MAIDQNVYLEKCIQARLVPFIDEHHSESNYVFWPDLSSLHNTETVLHYLIENSINLADKVDNLANLPEGRPIEDFWSISKGNLYANNWIAKDIPTIKVRIMKCLKEIESTTIKRQMDGNLKRIDIVKRLGVTEKKS